MLFVARGLLPYLDTSGRLLAAGLAAAAALLLVPLWLVLYLKDNRPADRLLPAQGLALAVGLSTLLRTLNDSLDLSNGLDMSGKKRIDHIFVSPHLGCARCSLPAAACLCYRPSCALGLDCLEVGWPGSLYNWRTRAPKRLDRPAAADTTPGLCGRWCGTPGMSACLNLPAGGEPGARWRALFATGAAGACQSAAATQPL